MYFPAEHVEYKLQISAEELREFEAKGVVRGIVKDSRTFYSSRDIYRLKGILRLMGTQGLSLEKAQERVDAPATQSILTKAGK